MKNMKAKTNDMGNHTESRIRCFSVSGGGGSLTVDCEVEDTSSNSAPYVMRVAEFVEPENKRSFSDEAILDLEENMIKTKRMWRLDGI